MSRTAAKAKTSLPHFLLGISKMIPGEILVWRQSAETVLGKGATTGRSGGGSGPQKIWTDHPNFFDEESDYRYVTDCSARNWVYYPYFVLYNNLDQGIGPQL